MVLHVAWARQDVQHAWLHRVTRHLECGDPPGDRQRHHRSELWRRYLPGDPHPHAFVMRIGTAIV
jgi:hypothetical protein